MNKPEIGVHGVTEIKSYDYGSFTDRKPDDFDFVCSNTFREYYNTQFGYLTSHSVTSKLAEDRQLSQERVECKPTELKPIRTIMRENHELKARIDLMESDVSGLKKGYHTHTGGKRKSKYD